MPTEQKILPCPFCGSDPAVLTGDGIHYAVCCTNEECPVEPHTAQCRNREDAVSAWNTRAEPPQSASRIESLAEQGMVFHFDRCDVMATDRDGIEHFVLNIDEIEDRLEMNLDGVGEAIVRLLNGGAK